MSVERWWRRRRHRFTARCVNRVHVNKNCVHRTVLMRRAKSSRCWLLRLNRSEQENFQAYRTGLFKRHCVIKSKFTLISRLLENKEIINLKTVSREFQRFKRKTSVNVKYCISKTPCLRIVSPSEIQGSLLGSRTEPCFSSMRSTGHSICNRKFPPLRIKYASGSWHRKQKRFKISSLSLFLPFLCHHRISQFDKSSVTSGHFEYFSPNAQIA